MEKNLCSLREVQFIQTFIPTLHEFHITALSYEFFYVRLKVFITVTEDYHFSVILCHVMWYQTTNLPSEHL